MSYYPEHVFYQSNDPQPSESASPPQEGQRRCSVKGCGKPLPTDYVLKMCEACRGRHRIYATTKRAKRKLEKAAVGAHQLGREDDQPVTWMPADDAVSPAVAEPAEPGALHLVWDPQIDPVLFNINPTSSELAGALTLPSNIASGSPDSPDIEFSDENTSPSSSGPTVQPRFCSVKGCRNIVPGEYGYKMCEGCRDRYRGYGNTKRSKWKREREALLAKVEKMKEIEDERRAKEGLPPMSELPACERNAWESNILHGFPPPSPTEYTPSSELPMRMCTVSHCHEVLPGHYQFRRCEQHRLQNRHHSKLKRVRDKEVKAIPLVDPNASTQDGEGRKKKEKTVEPLYTSAPLDLEGREAKIQQAGEEAEDENTAPDDPPAPPPVRGIRRTNHVCSIKACYNMLDPNSPWKMCDSHREKDRISRRRKAERDKEKKAAEESGTMVFMSHDGQSKATVSSARASVVDTGDTEQPEATSSGAGSSMVERTDPSRAPTPMEESSYQPSSDTTPPVHNIVFMDPLLPPSESTDPSSNAPTTATSTAGPGGSDPSAASTSAAPTSASAPVTLGSSTSPSGVIEEPPKKKRGPYKRKVKEAQPVRWHTASVSAPSTATVTNATQSSNSTTQSQSAVDAEAGLSTEAVPTPSTSAAAMGSTPQTASSPTASPMVVNANPQHMQPQYGVPYYMPPPFSMPFPHGQPPYYVPIPYPPRAPYAAYGAPFQAFQTLPAVPMNGQMPGQMPTYMPRPYGFPPWSPYAPAGIPAGEMSPFTSQPLAPQPAAEKPTRKRKSSTTNNGEGGDLRFVMHKPAGPKRVRRKVVNPLPLSSQAAVVDNTDASTSSAPARSSSPAPMGRLTPEPPAAGPSAAAQSPVIQFRMPPPPVVAGASENPLGKPDHVESTAVPSETKSRLCSSGACHRRIPSDTPGTVCERCRIRFKKHQERAKIRYRLQPKKSLAARSGSGQPSADLERGEKEGQKED
ncbi:hypothetical protein BV25DRAFT_1822764 [Artomyces pyxidatus]|uniref:Uncharacterized protein n=1 Tax=Artomyces pyxidatus TaxID=48021 RepID=A0ACB8T863_9AGAM|nr:hypothetical protein BV25DRAFT_1822764 [Artomyces pyxidatus]